MGPDGSTPEKEAGVTRATHMTMAWAVFLYLVVLTVAFLGKVKPFWQAVLAAGSIFGGLR